MASPTISSADRIRELSAINADVAAMLQSAGQAVNSLTNRPLDRSGEDEDSHMGDTSKAATLDERKEAFEEHTKAYYNGLQAIVARLRRQAYALEEAGIIAAEAPALSSGAQQRQAGPGAGTQRGQPLAAPAQDAERITNGGLGNLDVGWLNSRGNKVGAEKENDLVQEAKKLLEKTLSSSQSSKDVNGVEH
ncbi:hypothetical protein LTR37_003602 [Vermiconidia calcicola]|uniref:Uncharacterized protein n=1 Tax=Vermiconidia calcicola TaxID=1690605 RepID=A0ACC3NQF5_9PEZI|nr:hypothetical protein LTR37_003602 [Vermiconidia calcicola]